MDVCDYDFVALYKTGVRRRICFALLLNVSLVVSFSADLFLSSLLGFCSTYTIMSVDNITAEFHASKFDAGYTPVYMGVACGIAALPVCK